MSQIFPGGSIVVMVLDTLVVLALEAKLTAKAMRKRVEDDPEAK